MNQILAIENKKSKAPKGKNSKGPADIKSIVRVFAVAIILFGIFMIGQGSYALVQNMQEKEKQNALPTVDIQRDEQEILIKANYSKVIDKIIYNWNGEEETILQGKGRNSLEESIPLKPGDNTLNVTVVASDGKQAKFQKQYSYQKDDMEKPEIEVSDNGDGTIKITAKDNIALSYIKYSLEGMEETTIEANEQNPKIIEEKVQVEMGEKTLKVIAVDTSNNENIEEIEIKGATKPKVELYQSGDKKTLIIVAKDNIKLEKVEGSINGNAFSTQGQELEKEQEFELPLYEGNNDITVTVYNSSGLSETVSVSCTY